MATVAHSRGLAPFDGDDVSCAWVAPVALATGASAVLKLGMPHMEGEHEIEGLRFWNSDPTVRLLDADDDVGAMLLERCEPGTGLSRLRSPTKARPSLRSSVVYGAHRWHPVVFPRDRP